VLRHLALVFIVVMAAGMLAAVGWLLVGGLAERVGPAADLRLTALDVLAAPSPDRVRGLAVLEDARGRRVRSLALFFRFDDGYVGSAWVNPEGLAVCVRQGGQTAGRHAYEVFVSELLPQVGLCARASAWVEPTQTPVLWMDAAAVVPIGAEEAPASAEARRALQTLASGRRVVYLVAAEAADYAAARERIGEADLPEGPVLWVEPGTEENTLWPLGRTWPNVVGAVLASERLVQAAKRARAETFLVRPAGETGSVPAARLSSWNEVVRRLGPGAAAD
jgi:hypothetical protein